MPHAVPARMFASAFYYNSQTQRRCRVVALPLVAALVEPGSRYSIADPRDPPPAPTRRTVPRPPPSTSGNPGRPRKTFDVERPEDDPMMAWLLAADDIDAPIE